MVPAGPTKGVDFGTDVDSAYAWAEQQSSKGKNIYWTVNRVSPGVNKKPLKTDMEGVRYAHVDVDPPKDSTPWDLQGSLADLKSFDPPPSFVISSGNGLQGLWRLEGASLDEVEMINKALIFRFGGDIGTGNCDRLLRLPGFTNFPTQKKREAGRVPVMASVVCPDDGTHTTAADLRMALDVIYVPTEDSQGGEASQAEPAKSPPLGEVLLLNAADLGLATDEYLTHLIDKPKGKNRSADVFSLACEMGRVGYSREEIAGVLLNPGNAVSAHCFSQADPERAAQRAIEGAFKQVGVVRRQQQRQSGGDLGKGSEEVPPARIYTVKEMLTQFVFIMDGSQVADRDRPQSRLSFKDFQKATAASIHKVPKPDGGFKSFPCAGVWLNHADRLTVETVTFRAGAGSRTDAPDGRSALNLWAPPARAAPLDGWAEKAKPFIDHVEWLWGEYAGKFFDWLAHIEQNPGALPHFGWLHVSKVHGKGRGFLGGVLIKLWPGNVAGSFDLLGALNSQFNDRLSRCILAIVDEIHEGGNTSYRHAQAVRQMVTAEQREINIKCGRRHVEFNSARWLIFSNHVDALPLDAHDRRFFIVDHDGPVRDAACYTELYGLLQDPEFIAAVAEFLRQRDISHFNPGETPPMTKAKLALIDMTRTEAEKILEDIVKRWPVDVVGWSEITQLMGDHAPSPGAVKHITGRAGLVRLKPRPRVASLGLDPATVYSIRNHDVWEQASSSARRNELTRVATAVKDEAFYADEGV